MRDDRCFGAGRPPAETGRSRPATTRQHLQFPTIVWAAVLPGLILGATAQKLPGHSISAIPDINALASEWYLAGTVIPSLRSLVLSPGVPGRAGMLWSQTPLTTNDFEVSFAFTAQPPQSQTGAVRDDGFALWLTYENATAAQEALSVQHLHNQESIIADTWEAEFAAKEMDLLFYRRNFRGLGVFFIDDAKQQKSTVSAVVNDGSKAYKLQTDIPTADAIKVDFRGGWEVLVKLRVQPTSAHIEVAGHGSVELKGDFQPGAYLGVTSFGGTGQRSSFVELHRLEVTNHAGALKGEEARVVPAAVPRNEEDREDVLRAASSFKDHRDESEAIQEITSMVFKLLVETMPSRLAVQRAMESLNKRIAALEGSFRALEDVFESQTGHKLVQEFEAIKAELLELSAVASKDGEERHKRLGDLHTDIAHVHQVTQTAESVDKHLEQLTQSHAKVLDQLQTEHQTMFGVSLAAIAFIFVAGFSLYNKFRCWEKKHVL